MQEKNDEIRNLKEKNFWSVCFSEIMQICGGDKETGKNDCNAGAENRSKVGTFQTK